MASRRLDADGVLDMLSDVETDAESEDEIGEPVCPGSDDEFPIPDSGDESPSPDSDRYYYKNPCITATSHTINFIINSNNTEHLGGGGGGVDKEPESKN